MAEQGTIHQATGEHFHRIKSESILAGASMAVNGDRAENYGTQLINFTHIARMWGVILERTITPQEVAMCMIALKLARLKKTSGTHRDSIMDIAGYAECLDQINQQQKQPQPERTSLSTDTPNNAI